MEIKIQYTNTNPNFPSDIKQNPIQALATSLRFMSAYVEALLREPEIPEEEPESIPVICVAPDRKPFVEFSDNVKLLQSPGCINYIKEEFTGLMMAYEEGNILADDNGEYLIGPAALFRCDENANLVPVTSRDYGLAEQWYRICNSSLELKGVTFPAIQIFPAGDRPT